MARYQIMYFKKFPSGFTGGFRGTWQKYSIPYETRKEAEDKVDEWYKRNPMIDLRIIKVK